MRDAARVARPGPIGTVGSGGRALSRVVAVLPAAQLPRDVANDRRESTGERVLRGVGGVGGVAQEGEGQPANEPRVGHEHSEGIARSGRWCSIYLPGSRAGRIGDRVLGHLERAPGRVAPLPTGLIRAVARRTSRAFRAPDRAGDAIPI